MPGNETTTVSLDARRTLRRIAVFFISVEVLLVVADYLSYGDLVRISDVRRMFNMASEAGVATWFAATQTLLSALVLWILVGVVHSRAGGRFIVAGWVISAAFFTLMAFDDGARIHERLGEVFEHVWSEGGPFEQFPSYIWQVTVLPPLLLVGGFVVVFIWVELSTRASRGWWVVAVALLAAALVLEFIEGLDEDHPLNVQTRIVNSGLADWLIFPLERPGGEVVRHFARVLEEFLEMLANTVMLVVLVGHLARDASKLEIRWTDGRS